MDPSEHHVRRTDRKRAAIIAAAVADFGTRGFDNTSMDAIAERASVSKRTVYNHFPSKEDLFAAIVDGLKARCDLLADYQFDPAAPLETQLTEIARAAINLVASDQFQSLARVVLPRFLQSPELAREMMGEPYAGIVHWIEAAQAAGRLTAPNALWAGKQFVGLINSLAFWPQILGGERSLTEPERDEIVATAVAMFLARYAA